MKFKKGDKVFVEITAELASKMPSYFEDAKILKGRVFCRMTKAKVPSYRIDFSPFVQIQVPAELVHEKASTINVKIDGR